MATSTKRSWKLQEFTAHEANVNCLALGHKSGRVLVTGGDDKKVNLWAVGKPNCIMSLSGHSTPIEAVRFNYSEELVCAGSQTGAIKIWDLEAAKLLRTLTGHKSGIKTTDFHPYGDFLASGSHDTVIKLWDTRRKGCIFTYRGHRLTVNSLKFSPDGQWIASGGEEGLVKVWDLRMGRVLKEFSEHTSAVSSVEFHPNEFLLASGSLDRTVNFWDLESFQLVSSEKDVGAVRSIAFHPGGECLYSGSSDTLRVIGWEPSRTFDTVNVGWGRVHDIATAQNQLIGASFHMANVLLFVVVIKKLQPFGDPIVPEIKATSPFTRESVRRSFSREKSIGLSPKSVPQVKTIEESASGTDQEEETAAEIPNVTDYQEVFRPNRSLARTPPPEEPFVEPAENEQVDPTKPQILLPPSHTESDYLSLSSLELHSNGSASLKHESNSLELQSTCRTENLTLENHHASSFPTLNTSNQNYNRSLSNLDTIFTTKRPLQSEPVNINQKNPHIILPDADSPPEIDSPPTSDPVQPVRVKSPASIPSSPPQKINTNIRRQNSCKDVPHSNNNNGFPNTGLRHSASEVNINRTTQQIRNNTLNKNLNNAPTSRKEISNRLTNNRNSNGSRIPNSISMTNRSEKQPMRSNHPTPVDIYVTPRNNVNNKSSATYNSIKQIESEEKNHDVDFIPMPVDKPVGLDFNDFLPKSNYLLGSNQTMSNMSEAEVLGSMMRGHEPMMTVLKSRTRSLQVFYTMWQNKGVKAALEGAIALNDLSVIVDILGVIALKTSLWNLDICVLTLPKIYELLQSRYETYMQVGCNALRLILQNFSPVIKSNVQTPCGSFGVDIPREERYKKCKSCHDNLLSIRAFLLKRQTMQGALGTTFRDLHKLMQTLD